MCVVVGALAKALAEVNALDDKLQKAVAQQSRLQKQLDKLQQHDDAEELIADIFELLHQESKKFNLILNPRTRFSPFLEDLLKVPIEHFKLHLSRCAGK